MADTYTFAHYRVNSEFKSFTLQNDKAPSICYITSIQLFKKKKG